MLNSGVRLHARMHTHVATLGGLRAVLLNQVDDDARDEELEIASADFFSERCRMSTAKRQQGHPYDKRPFQIIGTRRQPFGLAP